MSRPSYFYRNARAGERLELFLISAVSSLLLLRFFLHLSHYPTVGGRSFHIAHMLYGGLLMTAALIMVLAFIGNRVQRLASILGGVGFGLFIDELGKFITRDNNYFFQPTIAIIYVIFMLLFVLFRFLARTRRLSPAEYLLNAVVVTEEVALKDLDEAERRRALAYLDRAGDQPLVAALREALHKSKVSTDNPTAWERWSREVERTYERLISTRFGVVVVDVVFIVKALIFLIPSTGELIDLLQHETVYHFVYISALQLASSSLSAVLILAGVLQIRRSRLSAYDLFAKSLLVDIFITQFFAFYRYQFGALPGFLLNIVLYIAVRFLVRQERRLLLRRTRTQ